MSFGVRAHRKTFASAVLGDGLVRVHTVAASENPMFHKLLLAWGKRTGLPVLYNTSFNLFGVHAAGRRAELLLERH